MLQSSITSWLKKPTAPKKAAQPIPPPEPALALLCSRAEAPISEPRGMSGSDGAHESEHVQHEPTAIFSILPPPSNVELTSLSNELMPAFKRLLTLTLPVSYPSIFFSESMKEPFHSITLMALWHPSPLAEAPTSTTEKPRLVGAIRCRILPEASLYISTISVLAPYRSHGIAAYLLQRIAVKASQEHGVTCITAHVWEANDDGLEWYKKRGFDIIGKEEGYYGKLKPSGAILVRKWIRVADFLPRLGPESNEKK